MAGWRRSEIEAEVIWLGLVPEAGDTLRSAPRDVLGLDFGGARGESHYGDQRPACSRVREMHPIGTPIANARQLSLVSSEELAEIAADMGLDGLDPAWLGATVVLRGIRDFSNLPPASRLQAPSGATLAVDVQNGPCVLVGREIEREAPGRGPRFKPAAQGRRGVTARVERPGRLGLGDRLSLFLPDQRAWQGEAV